MHPFQALTVPQDRVGIHWFGASSFALKDPSGTVVQIDPYFPSERPPERYIHAEPPLDEAALKTDTVLVTHDHLDHTFVESLLRIHAAFPNARFIGPVESVAHMGESGIPEALMTTVTAGDTISLGTMTAYAVWTKPPEGDPEADIDPPDVAHLGFVVEAGPVRVYISGDPLRSFADRDDLLQPIADLQPDIGLLTTQPAGREFPSFAGSVEIALKLGLKAAAPAHYGCSVRGTYDPHEWAAGFPEQGPRPIVIPYNEAIVFPS